MSKIGRRGFTAGSAPDHFHKTVSKSRRAKGQLLDRQIHALTEAGCVRIFSDMKSGKNAKREELWKALDYLRVGDTLVVPSLDRRGRSIQDLNAIVSGLRKRGVGFTSLHEALGTTTPGGLLVFHVFAALAEFIRGLIVQGTNEDLDAARARGARLGRPPAMTEEQVRPLWSYVEKNSIVHSHLRAWSERTCMPQGRLAYVYADVTEELAWILDEAFAEEAGTALWTGPDKEHAEASMLPVQLIQSALVYVNTLLVQALTEPARAKKLSDEDRRGLTAWFWSNVNPYGAFRLDTDKRLDLGL
ncbi:recombinase family protein [Streptomyces sp. 8K308]|uniref:recombinase family protein n=1 Tax=Streptomyces sp. 8K308 TaxID=2530388 RepID=UPI001FB7BBDC|nr:recombinase family protein [Streptomyces sp. 8K308]